MTNAANAYDNPAIIAAIDSIMQGLDRVVSGLGELRSVIVPDGQTELEFDPKDSRNKYEIGGLEKLTERGVEICYRLFDSGKTRYAVSQLMDISFGAATHRHHAWEKAGGAKRTRMPLD